MPPGLQRKRREIISSTHAIAALWSSAERPAVAAADALAADWSEHEKAGHAKPLNLRMLHRALPFSKFVGAAGSCAP